MLRVYLASRYSRREELCEYRSDLERLSYRVTSRWLNGAHQVTDDQLRADGTYPAELRTRFALEDWEDLMEADWFIGFTEEPRSPAGGASRGGRHVEMGAALAAQKMVWIVGPAENVFCHLPWVVRHDRWEDVLDKLARSASERTGGLSAHP